MWIHSRAQCRLVLCLLNMHCFHNCIVMCILVDVSMLPSRGPCSKYAISIAEGDFKGKLELSFESEPMRVRNQISHKIHIACISYPPPPHTHTHTHTP